MRAQQSDRVRRIGVLMATAEDDPETKLRLAGLQQGLEKLGWSEGRNIHLDKRFAAAPSEDQARVFAKEMVALRPDVILAQSTPITAAFQRETRAIPIVFVFVNDPIGSGFIANLARPGGNLTGLTLFEAGIAGKWLSMLKEIAPHLARAGFMFNPKTVPKPILRSSRERKMPPRKSVFPSYRSKRATGRKSRMPSLSLPGNAYQRSW